MLSINAPARRIMQTAGGTGKQPDQGGDLSAILIRCGL
jgi:hypothetical protein